MKKLINIILFRLIAIIERVQFRKADLNEDDNLKKIKNITFTDKEDLYVESPDGWTKVLEINETQPYRVHYIRTNGSKELFCADNHILFDECNNEVLVKYLEIGDYIKTKDGDEFITYMDKYSSSMAMIDLTVDNDGMNYYTNDILSHNTVTAIVTLLHYAIFNKDKGIMVVANKADTVIEIIDKIKNLYKLLPFFLKPGIINWNLKNISFDNGCRIKSQARSKEPAIGFTIDFLYMDEFAHIPPNIINNYYRAAVPTVSSLDNSKIVITSTPNGANLFKDLVIGAKLPKGDPNKNMYNYLQVMWYQVPDGKFEDGTRGTRLDPKLFPKYEELDKAKVSLLDIKSALDKAGFKTVIDYESTNSGKVEYLRILYIAGKSDIDIIRKSKIGTVSLIRLFDITNWHENEIKLIGGEENFNQEYNCLFVAGSKRVLAANTAKELENRQVKYKYRKIETFGKLRFGYDNLKWSPEYIESDRNKYYWFAAIDTSEGLGADSSVINLFQLRMRSHSWLQKNKISNIYDAFYLHQVGLFEDNIISPDVELPQLSYLLFFEYLNPSRLKVSLELNGPGSAYLASMPNVFNGKSKYGSYIFVRYQHRADTIKKKIGLKMTKNKKLLVKKYITHVENNKMYVNEENTINQMDTFIKVQTPSGGFTYKADSGHDDIVMTNVIGCTFFDTMEFKSMCTAYYKELSEYDRKMIDGAVEVYKVLDKPDVKYKENTRRQDLKNRRRNKK